MSVNKILEVGIPLDTMGVKNWGLNKQQAIEAAHKLLSLDVPILGGDVVEKKAGKLEHNYDNWYCDKNPNESHKSYAERSCLYTLQYIERYAAKDMNNIYFVIIPDESTMD